MKKLLKLLSFIALTLSSCTPDSFTPKVITYRRDGTIKQDTVEGEVKFLPKDQARVNKNIIYPHNGWGDITFECHDCELISTKSIKESK